ncbi:MAG TPA: peptidoglycan binding domain-containing protein [Clostridia bacterium]|nr:peptidoglycan binding domain-containing protein [Clostridia bacterium]
MRTRRKKTTGQRKKPIAIVILFIALILMAGTGLRAYINRILDTDTFYEGITIDGLSMGGLTKQSAEKLLREKNQARLDNLKVGLLHQSDFWTLGYKDMGVSIDISEKTKEAYGIARTGHPLKRFLMVQRLRREGRSFHTKLTYSVDSLQAEVERVAAAIDRDTVDATVTFNPDGEKKFNISPEEEGLSLDTSMVISQIREVLDGKTTTDTIILSPNRLTPKV